MLPFPVISNQQEAEIIAFLYSFVEEHTTPGTLTTSTQVSLDNKTIILIVGPPRTERKSSYHMEVAPLVQAYEEEYFNEYCHQTVLPFLLKCLFLEDSFSNTGGLSPSPGTLLLDYTSDILKRDGSSQLSIKVAKNKGLSTSTGSYYVSKST